jgi:hypothetical protein
MGVKQQRDQGTGAKVIATDNKPATVNIMENINEGRARRQGSSNYMLSPAMWRLSVPFFILLASCLGVALFVCWRVQQFVEHVGAVNPSIGHLLDGINQMIFETALSGFAVFSVLCIALWLLYSHRIFGAAVPIRKQVENLCQGNFGEKIILRQSDELKEIADGVNRLTEILRNNAK